MPCVNRNLLANRLEHLGEPVRQDAEVLVRVLADAPNRFLVGIRQPDVGQLAADRYGACEPAEFRIDAVAGDVVAVLDRTHDVLRQPPAFEQPRADHAMVGLQHGFLVFREFEVRNLERRDVVIDFGRDFVDREHTDVLQQRSQEDLLRVAASEFTGEQFAPGRGQQRAPPVCVEIEPLVGVLGDRRDQREAERQCQRGVQSEYDQRLSQVRTLPAACIQCRVRDAHDFRRQCRVGADGVCDGTEIGLGILCEFDDLQRDRGR